jgi:hypothetical protein
MAIYLSRIFGGFWILWGLLSFPFAVGVAIISSSNMGASDMLGLAAVLWLITGGLQIGFGGRLVYKPKSGDKADLKIRTICLWMIFISFALQMATVPIIPWD